MTVKALTTAARDKIWLTALSAAVSATVAGGGAVALRSSEVGTLRTDIQAVVQQEMKAPLQQIRDEQETKLQFYVTKDQFTAAREQDRERVETKIDALRSDVQRLALAVERLRR